ncbi:hypothetical protein BV20DRAFT_995755, partial [Pilatotrama ljubarskyi]
MAVAPDRTARALAAPHARRPQARSTLAEPATSLTSRGRRRDGVPPLGPVRRARSQPPAAADTGRAETSREFAKRIKRVILHVPDEGREGARPSTGHNESKTTDVHDQQVPPINVEDTDSPPPAVHYGDRFLDHLTEASEGVDLLEVLRGRYSSDPFFAKIIQAPKEYKNFREENGLLFIRERGLERLCIPAILEKGRSVREIVILHAHSLLAHLGAYKTLGLLRDHVWWKS